MKTKRSRLWSAPWVVYVSDGGNRLWVIEEGLLTSDANEATEFTARAPAERLAKAVGGYVVHPPKNK